jgi:hypothetical protein
MRFVEFKEQQIISDICKITFFLSNQSGRSIGA